ncbi:MAG TPA: hypothetical protein PLD95_03050 [bacterium]|jgi:hypothetical protein|nr:hypothetical protein [bacterium]HOG38425.1 hypothetical protein [bacterium]HQI03314.1 hypothetical protein [bacterium]
MLYLNILPKELKQEIKFSKLYEVVQKIVIFVCVFIVFCTVVLLYSNFMLVDNLKIRKRFVHNVTTQNDSYKEAVDIASSVDQILTIQSKFFKPSMFLMDMINLSGDSISFTSLSIDKASNKAFISGFATTRDDLLNFKNQLSPSKNYANVNLPIENLLVKEKIPFSISFEIKSYEYQ